MNRNNNMIMRIYKVIHKPPSPTQTAGLVHPFPPSLSLRSLVNSRCFNLKVAYISLIPTKLPLFPPTLTPRKVSRLPWIMSAAELDHYCNARFLTWPLSIPLRRDPDIVSWPWQHRACGPGPLTLWWSGQAGATTTLLVEVRLRSGPVQSRHNTTNRKNKQ